MIAIIQVERHEVMMTPSSSSSMLSRSGSGSARICAEPAPPELAHAGSGSPLFCKSAASRGASRRCRLLTLVESTRMRPLAGRDDPELRARLPPDAAAHDCGPGGSSATHPSRPGRETPRLSPPARTARLSLGLSHLCCPNRTYPCHRRTLQLAKRADK